MRAGPSSVPFVRYARATEPGGGASPIAARVRARISSRAALTTPPLAKGLLRNRRQVARLQPLRKRARHPARRPLRKPREPLRTLVEPRIAEHARQRVQGRSLTDVLLRPCAQVQKHARDVDLDGTHLV